MVPNPASSRSGAHGRHEEPPSQRVVGSGQLSEAIDVELHQEVQRGRTCVRIAVTAKSLLQARTVT